jgi:iron complex transport system substrate-binding protein
MNQGATEFLLALGLADKMAGTAYLDDAIWPKYASDYAKIPVLSSGYPDETTIMSADPDFIVASYNSAFRQVYDGTRGIFSEATVGPCVGEGAEWEDARPTCRPQLHEAGVGTYLFSDACEDTSLRPPAVSEATVYSEMRDLGSIFKVDVEPLIQGMKDDFDAAAAMVSTATKGGKMTAVWLDCVGRCCSDEGPEPHVFIGAGNGAPAMLMREAGLDNVFDDVEGNWACVPESQVIAAAPDVLVVVDAAWDTALSKIQWLFNHTEFCDLDALKGGRFVQIPFSASTLSPRNGPAALDLAIASVYARIGTQLPGLESGVSSFDPDFFRTNTQGLACTFNEEYRTQPSDPAPKEKRNKKSKKAKTAKKSKKAKTAKKSKKSKKTKRRTKKSSK